MFSRIKKKQKEGGSELTPAVIESAALEIIQNADEILEMYGIDGSVSSIGLGLLPVNAKKKRPKDSGYEISISEDDDFGLSVKYKKDTKYKSGKSQFGG